MASRIFAVALLLVPLCAGAAELDGVKLEDEVVVDGHALQLNGVGLRANNSEAQLAQVQAQTEALYAMIRAKAHAHTGMHIVLDYAPSSAATTLHADGAALGPPMPGEDFFRALLCIWLGERPVQADLKEQLLGQRQAAAN